MGQDVIQLPILCFNDVYRVHQKYNAPPSTNSATQKANETAQEFISVSQFGHTLLTIREKWADVKVGDTVEKQGLVLFAGDLFSPSVESSVTRGSHMVPIINTLKVDCSLVGNHDFDFGYPHLTTLIKSCTFPWLLSNVVDTTTGKQPENLHKYWTTTRCGVKIGVIGLVEKDWIATIPSWPETFVYRSMHDTGIELSKELRDPQGEHKCDIVIALTHARVPNDIDLAVQLGAIDGQDVAMEHGVDLIIGGHDHMYYIGKGAASWEGDVGERGVPGTDKDTGVRLIKSGTDFRDLSEAFLDLESTSEGSVRKRVLKTLTGKHHEIVPSTPADKSFESLVENLLSTVSGTLSKPVCFTLTPFDARSDKVRTRETALGNWIADILLHAYAESLGEGVQGEDVEGLEKLREEERKLKGGADAVIICGGTLRGDSQYGPGKITLGDILEILPFDDPVVCLEIDGKGIWDTMEAALSKWPAQEGRFPIVSGLAVKWDHTRSPNARVLSINLVNITHDEEDDDDDDEAVDFIEQEDGTRVEIKQRKHELGEPVKNEQGGRIYHVVTRNYMAEGYDGFAPLKNRRMIIDDETGQRMSNIIRSFLLGSQYIFRHKQLLDQHQAHLSEHTAKVLARETRRASFTPSPRVSPMASPKSPLNEFRKIVGNVMRSPLSSPIVEKDEDEANGDCEAVTQKRHVVRHDWNAIRDALHVARHEHLSAIDCFDGDETRKQAQQPEGAAPSQAIKSFIVNAVEAEDLSGVGADLAIVSPLADGRMLDVAEGRSQ